LSDPSTRVSGEVDIFEFSDFACGYHVCQHHGLPLAFLWAPLQLFFFFSKRVGKKKNVNNFRYDIYLFTNDGPMAFFTANNIWSEKVEGNRFLYSTGGRFRQRHWRRPADRVDEKKKKKLPEHCHSSLAGGTDMRGEKQSTRNSEEETGTAPAKNSAQMLQNPNGFTPRDQRRWARASNIVEAAKRSEPRCGIFAEFPVRQIEDYLCLCKTFIFATIIAMLGRFMIQVGPQINRVMVVVFFLPRVDRRLQIHIFGNSAAPARAQRCFPKRR